MADAREVYPLTGSWDYRFDGGPSEKVTVPHTWNASDAADGVKGKRGDAKSVDSGVYKRGAAVYTRTLPVTPKPGKRYFIRGEGASIVSEVSVNGKPAGRHEGAFTAFCHEITPLLKKGGNTVSVMVDNTQRDHIAPQRGDFSMFGGLYRPIELIETDQVCIDPLFYASPGVFITTRSLDKSRAEVEVKTLLNAAEAKGDVAVAVEILDKQGKKVAGKTVKASAEEKKSLEVPVVLTISNPVPWNATKNPYLYQVKVSIRTADGQTDEMVQPLGLRTVSIDPQQGFVLNGKTMQIKGVSRHQDRKGKGWALSPEDEAQDIKMIADMGADGLRTAHYPASTNIYDLCDKTGLVVWSEVSNVNLVRDTPEFRENNRLQAREMIYQHWNHPSICMWGIFNEIGHQAEASTKGVDMEAELIELNKFVKETDPTRMTVGASNQPGRKKLNNIPDHIAFNSYPGWYGGGPETMKGNLNGFIRDHASKGVAISEYGHGASTGMHENPPKRPSPTGFWHPEEWQTHAHEINYKCIKERPEVWGSFVWNMFDFGSAGRFEGENPGINDKGLVTYDRKTPKDAYFFYRANWSPKPTVYITSRRFAERTEKTVPVKVYSNASSVKLSVNGKAVGSAKPDELRRAVWPEVALKPGVNTITATATIGGKTYTDSCKWTLKPGKEGEKGSERYQDPSIKKYK
ncbi:glycoside hydrolase family 2 TIM barrel-domain containing protein [Akkermansia sp. KLE1797]|nr:glycoside hydrolase family 2 TIM barrel-domain containing protein [Akkermansia sp. KLE1797]KXT49663.1 glycosyl hydrolase family 2, sugar binding domain protein [Akkermansia sp. KLE1797]KXU53589.1 glycosyl hydrolase family 2, sugar binding domain protein [Akkermansia sp. KLE1798]KZA05784.1 glycosyl hydrolase family 2, sugar binding domain protein [Akkermansia sp. KLE1605]